jgi:hypothetical protein
MLGYRIPTEGKQSTIVFKVVGFLPKSYGSTVVLPDDIITRSGADFDIDSLYIISYNLIEKPAVKDENGLVKEPSRIEVLNYDNSKSLEKNQIKEKQNRLLDIMFGILQNPAHFIDNILPQSYTASRDAADDINKLLKITQNLKLLPFFRLK